MPRAHSTRDHSLSLSDFTPRARPSTRPEEDPPPPILGWDWTSSGIVPVSPIRTGWYCPPATVRSTAVHSHRLSYLCGPTRGLTGTDYRIRTWSYSRSDSIHPPNTSQNKNGYTTSVRGVTLLSSQTLSGSGELCTHVCTPTVELHLQKPMHVVHSPTGGLSICSD